MKIAVVGPSNTAVDDVIDKVITRDVFVEIINEQTG